METGALGWAFHDRIQPLLDEYERQKNGILSSGVHGEIARMQAMDDAMANSGTTRGGATDIPYGLARQPDQMPFSASDPGPGVLGSLPSNNAGGQRSNAGFQFDAGNGGFTDRPNMGQLGPNGPGSAAFVHPSTPSQIADESQLTPPAPTLEDAARGAPFNMNDADLAAIRQNAILPLYVEHEIRHALPSVIAYPLPPGLKYGVTVPGKIINDMLDRQEPERREQAYQRDLFLRMNDTMAQSLVGQVVSPAMRGFFIK